MTKRKSTHAQQKRALMRLVRGADDDIATVLQGSLSMADQSIAFATLLLDAMRRGESLSVGGCDVVEDRLVELATSLRRLRTQFMLETSPTAAPLTQ